MSAAFADEGIRFTGTRRDSFGTTWLGVGPPPWGEEKTLYVTILPEKGVVGLGHGECEEGAYEQRLGNMIVHYGGDNEQVLEHV